MAGAGTYPYRHHQWPPSTAPPAPVTHPPPYLADNHNNRPPPNDEIRTVFITGLPDDVKEQELQNMLRWFPGYEASQVNNKGEHPLRFALFSTPHYAISAKDTLQSKRLRTGGDYTHSGHNSPAPFHTSPAPPPVWTPHGYMAQAPQQYDPYGGYPMPPIPMLPPPLPAPGSDAPCSTLCIGNLGENINEEELRGLISGQPGFRQMKVLRQERHTVCFIEFEYVNSAANVHRNLQGAVIPCSGSVGMRIQYSKNPFGKRKDESYPLSARGTNGTPKNMGCQ